MEKFVFTNARSDAKCPIPNKWSELAVSTYDANIGANKCVITGKNSNVTVVDVDNNNDTLEKFNEMLKNHDTFTTLVCKTLNGGYHYYFKYIKDIKTCVKINNYSVDIRNDGACVICPPSTYRDKGYEWIDESIEPIEMPEWLKQWVLMGQKNKVEESDTEEEDDKEVEEEDLNKLKLLLEEFPYINYSKKFDRNKWLYFVALIKSAGGDWQLSHKYSLKLPEHEPCECEKVFNSIKKLHVKPLYKLRSLIDKYDYKNSDVFKKQYRFNFKDDYQIDDFCDEFTDSCYESIMEFEIDALPKLKRVCVYISSLNEFACRYRKIIMKKEIVSMPAICIKDGKKVEQIKLKDYIMRSKTLRFSEVDYILDDQKDLRIFNKWLGYDSSIIDNPDQEAIDAIIDVIYKVMCNQDDNILKYVLTWFSNIVSTIEINKVALVLIGSEQGGGKGTIIELIQKMLGLHCSVSVAGITPLTQKHNDIIDGQRLIIVNEAASTKEEFRNNFEKLKTIITDPTVDIEPKNLRHTRVNNIGNYIIVSNHADSMVVEQSDRRYQVLECSDTYLNDTVFWGKWRKKCLTTNGANSFYTYLMNYKDKVDLFKIIDTSLKQEMKLRSLPNTLKFMLQYKEDLENNNRYYADNTFKIQSKELFAEYVRWAKEENEKNIATATKFGLDIKKQIESIKTNKGCFYIIMRDENYNKNIEQTSNLNEKDDFSDLVNI